MKQIKGIDVSKWNAEIDWKKVRADGVEFAMIRTGYFTNYLDPYFEKNYSGAKAAGVKVGTYHYSYALNAAQAQAEADFVISILKGKTLDYPVAFDIEDKTQMSLGKKVITDMIVSFCEKIRAAGHRPMFYVSTDWRKNYVDITRTANYFLWQAHWTTNRPAVVDDRAVIWQYSDKGKVNGINGNVDMNYDFVDLSIKTPKPILPPEPPTAEVTQIKLYDTVKIKQGAKSYEGVNMAAFVYERLFNVDQLKGDRAVLDIKGFCTAFNVKDLTRAS